MLEFLEMMATWINDREPTCVVLGTSRMSEGSLELDLDNDVALHLTEVSLYWSTT